MSSFHDISQTKVLHSQKTRPTLFRLSFNTCIERKHEKPTILLDCNNFNSYNLDLAHLYFENLNLIHRHYKNPMSTHVKLKNIRMFLHLHKQHAV